MVLCSIFEQFVQDRPALAGPEMSKSIDLEARYCAHNYHPVPVVIEKAELDWAVTQLREVPEEMDRVRLAS